MKSRAFQVAADAENWARLLDLRAQSKRAVSPGAVAYVVVMHLEKINVARFASALDNDPAMRVIFDEISAILRQHGRAEDDPWPVGEGPPDFEGLRGGYAERVDAIHAQIYEAAGQPTLAEITRRGRLITLVKNCAPIFARECVFNEVQ
jgi:hypothetical protein